MKVNKQKRDGIRFQQKFFFQQKSMLFGAHISLQLCTSVRESERERESELYLHENVALFEDSLG